MGVGEVDAGGRLRIASDAASVPALVRLSAWVQSQVAAEPGLARLRGAMLVRTDHQGRVRSCYQDPSLWDAVPEPVLPGSAADAADRLAHLRPGPPCRAWVTPCGPSGAPMLWLSPIKAEPQEIARAIGALQMLPGVHAGAVGIVQRTAAGSVLLTTASALEAVDEALTVLGASPLLQPWVARTILARLGADGQVVRRMAASLPAAVDLTAQAVALHALRPDAGLWLWFGRKEEGTPRLRLAPTRSALEAVLASEGGGEGVLGQLRDTGTALEIRLRHREAPRVFSALAGWASTQGTRWPALQRLEHATLVTRSQDA